MRQRFVVERNKPLQLRNDGLTGGVDTRIESLIGYVANRIGAISREGPRRPASPRDSVPGEHGLFKSVDYNES